MMGRSTPYIVVCLLGLFAVTYYASRRSASVPTITPAGIVRNERGEPIKGVCVRFKGSAESVVTDAAGHFDLPPGAEDSIVTASRPGYLIAGTRARRGPIELTLSRLPQDDNEGYRWVDPARDPAGKHNCANCHQEMFNEWLASGHSRSATGKHFRNLYEGTDVHGRANISWGLLTQYPEGSGVCTSCHAPTVAAADPAS